MLTEYGWGHIEASDFLFEAVLHDGTAVFRVRKPRSGPYFQIEAASKPVHRQVWLDITKAHAEWLEDKGGD